MVRLPVDIMTSSDRLSLPQGKMVVEKATANDFGGQVGTAIASLGDAAGQLAAKVQVNEERVKAFNYEKQALQLEEQDNTAYEQRTRQLNGSAEGHWQTARAETQTRYTEWTKTLPEAARAEYEARAQKFIGRRTAQAFQDQYKQQDNNTRVTLAEEQRKAGLAVQQQPENYSDFLSPQEKLIDTSPLTPIEKEQRKAEIRNALAYTAEQEKARRDPAAYVGAAAAGDEYRAKVRAKESSGNDQAQAGTSSARGRYQFLEGTWNELAARVGLPVVTPANRGTASDPRNNGDAQEKALDQFIKDNTAVLARNGLPVTDANLYVLHFAGKGDGPKLLAALKADPSAPAVRYASPAAVEANKSIFFERSEPRTVEQVVARLTKGLSGQVVNRAAPSAASANLTPQQSAAVAETARVELTRQQQQVAIAQDAERSTRMNQTLLDLKEGSNPEATYREARRSGLLSSFDDIQRAEGVIRARNKGEEDIRTGMALMETGRTVANQYNKDHRNGVQAVYERAVKDGEPPEKAALRIFDRTNIIPPQFALDMRGAIASGDKARAGPMIEEAAKLLTARPNAFAGVEGGAELEKVAIEFKTLYEDMRNSQAQAVEQILKNARDPELLSPVKQEQLHQFSKSQLTQEKIDSRLKSKFSAFMGFGGPDLPVGDERTALASIYAQHAKEGFDTYRTPTGALKHADFMMEKQFGVQNGVITRYPPDKAGLPAFEGSHKWINEQAAELVRSELGLVVDPASIILVPVERKGASTRAAFGGQPASVKREDGKSTFQSVPYTIQIAPTEVGGTLHAVNKVFFPDVDGYVASRNKSIEAVNATPYTGYDMFGVPFEVPAQQSKLLDTPEQAARRKKAEDEAAIQEARKNEGSEYYIEKGVMRAAPSPPNPERDKANKLLVQQQFERGVVQ